jgi:hemolysin activation/secretion protein
LFVRRGRRPFCPSKRLHHGALAILATGIVLVVASPGFAQTAPLPGATLPGPQLPTQPDFDFSIEAPHRSAVARAVDQIHFTLKDIQISGAKALPASQFRGLYQNLLGKDVTLADILNLADKIEQAYRDAGYILVRAFVPPQRVRDGVFTINVVEGQVAHVTVEGGAPATQDQVRAYLQKSVGVAPLPLTTMERSLLLANDLPGVTASGVLKPAEDVAGASDVVVDISQPRFTGGLGVDNRGSRFSGLWTLTGDAQVNSLFGDDQLGASLTTAPDASEQVAGQLRYRRAIGDDGLIASLIGTVTHGQPGSTLAAFDVRTDSWAVGPRLTYPLIRTRRESLSLDGGFTAQDAHVGILGSGFSHDQWRVLDLGATYLLSNWLAGAWAATIDVAQGLPIFGATPDHATILSRKGGVTDFTKLTGFGRYSAPLFGGFSTVLTAQGQYSFSPLITGEQISFGGLGIGRGYDPGGITGDHGIGGSAELRYDALLSNAIVLALEPYVYFDTAQTWYIQRGGAIDSALRDQSLASVGGGVRASLPYDATLGLEVSQTLDAVTGSDGGREATKVFVSAGIRL